MAPLRPVRVTLAAADGGDDPASVVTGAGSELLDRLDARHAVLRQPGAPAARILLLPSAAGSRPAGAPSRRSASDRDGRDGATQLEVVVDGWRFEVAVEDAGRADLRERATRGRAADGMARPAEVRAIIPGRIAAVAVVAGQQVAHGDPLLVIEAMKMQNELRAPRDGTIERVGVAPGVNIEVGDLLVVIS